MTSTASPSAHLSLASEFPAATESQWRALVDGVLKGAPFEKKLVAKTLDGVATLPLYPRRAEASPIAGARGVEPWRTVARVDDPDLVRANTMLIDELENGADMVALFFESGYAARGFGLPAPSPEVFAAALKGVHCDLVSLRMETSPHHGRGAAKAFLAFTKANRLPGATLDVDFGFSPLIYLALTNGAEMNFADAMSTGRTAMTMLRDEGFTGPFFRADGRLFHDAGAGDALELATVVAQGIAYLRGLTEAGVPLAEAGAALGFTLSLDQDQFASIAKIRALRLLWARVQAAVGLATTPIRIHAETSFRMMTKRDAEVNILRATIAAFAASMGGADSLSVLPFTAANGLPDGAARRLARNTSLMLSAETNLHRLIDPAAGAGAVEALTDGLAEAAWRMVQAIEAERATDIEGRAVAGMPAALANGSLAAQITEQRMARAKEIATRKWPITGTSEFPNINEAQPGVLAAALAERQDGAFPALRLAAPYEALRDRADALATAGQPPRVFLANLGTIAEFTARATFAKNAYEAGGIRAIGNDGFAEEGGTDLVALTDAFKASGASIACICGTDAAYAETAAVAAMALIASGASAVHLAGKPGDLEMPLRAAGISAFLALGMDLPAFLSPLLDEAA